MIFQSLRLSSFPLRKAIVWRGASMSLPQWASEIYRQRGCSHGKRSYHTKLHSQGLDIIPHNGSPSVYCDYVFLRDACQCLLCVDSSTQQRLFASADISPDISPREVRSSRDSGLQVTWTNDLPGYTDHTSIYPPDFFVRNSSYFQRVQHNYNLWATTPWNKSKLDMNIDKISFSLPEYLESKATLYKVIEGLLEFGLVFIHNVPPASSSVKTVAERIGPLRNTLYGETWDVRSIPSAKNVAYTSKDLGFHQDLLYMADPPGLQLLHMVKTSASGGESLFTDGLMAFYKLQDASPSLVPSLQKFPVTYHYHNDGHWYQRSRPTLEGGTCPHYFSGNEALDHGKSLSYPLDFDAINWSPPFQGPLEHAIGHKGDLGEAGNNASLRAYMRAANQLKTLMEEDDAVYETSMQSGTCVIFNNRRIMHARNAFDVSGGERWLRGAYIDSDCLRSLWRALNNEKGTTGFI